MADTFDLWPGSAEQPQLRDEFPHQPPGVRHHLVERRTHTVGGTFRDLRYMQPAVHARWKEIVLGGERQELGMPSFKDVLSEGDADALHAFIISKAQELYERPSEAP